MSGTADALPLTFEPWSRATADAVLGALDSAVHWSVAQGRHLLGPDEDGVAFRRARLVRAAATGEPVGFVVVRRTNDDPHWLWAHTEIVPEYRGRGLGAAALAHMSELVAGTHRGMRGKAVTGSAEHRWMTAHGFRRAQRHRTFRVRPGALGPVSHGYALEWFDGATGPVPDDAVRAWGDFLDATNWWHTPERTPLEQLRPYIDDRSDAPFVTARRPDGAVAGVAFLDDPFHGSDLDFSGGAVDPADPDARTIAAALLRLCGERLPEHDLLLELGDIHGETVALAEDIAAAVEDDAVFCERPDRAA